MLNYQRVVYQGLLICRPGARHPGSGRTCAVLFPHLRWEPRTDPPVAGVFQDGLLKSAGLSCFIIIFSTFISHETCDSDNVGAELGVLAHFLQRT